MSAVDGVPSEGIVSASEVISAQDSLIISLKEMVELLKASKNLKDKRIAELEADNKRLQEIVDIARSAVLAYSAGRKEAYRANVPEGGYVYMQKRAEFTITMLTLALELGIKEEDILCPN